MDQVEEFARARLAFISAGRPSPGAPRRAEADLEPDEPPPEQSGVSSSGEVPRPRSDRGHPAAASASQIGPATGAGSAGPAVARAPSEGDVAGGAPVARGLAGVLVGIRAGLTVKHALVVGLLLLAAVLVTVFALGRSAATEVPILPAVAPEPSAVAEPEPSQTAPPVLRVHVAGAVVWPGVIEVPQGSIVQDAIIAAGGLTAEADPAQLNLAAPVADGMQILIGTVNAPLGEIGGADPVANVPGGANGPLDLNTATQADLEDLPGVGPVTAGAILAWREENGRFNSVEELQEISGIGPKTFEKLAGLVKV